MEDNSQQIDNVGMVEGISHPDSDNFITRLNRTRILINLAYNATPAEYGDARGSISKIHDEFGRKIETYSLATNEVKEATHDILSNLENVLMFLESGDEEVAFEFLQRCSKKANELAESMSKLNKGDDQLGQLLKIYPIQILARVFDEGTFILSKTNNKINLLWNNIAEQCKRSVALYRTAEAEVNKDKEELIESINKDSKNWQVLNEIAGKLEVATDKVHDQLMEDFGNYLAEEDSKKMTSDLARQLLIADT